MTISISLKPENILIDASGYAKLTDFGLARPNVITDTTAKSMCGTLEYLAPEVAEGRGYGTAVDWWGLGCVIIELLTGRPPFLYTKLSEEALLLKIKSGKFTLPDNISTQCQDFLRVKSHIFCLLISVETSAS